MTEEKRLEDLTPEEQKDLKLVFAPGCFDSFEGSQEELDELVNEIKRLFASGEFFEKSKPLDVDELFEEDPELAEKLIKAADTMRDSGNLYLTWAKHFAALAEGNTDASSDEDETDDFGI